MWQLRFDSSLNQVYFVNTADGSILFDLPTEVHKAGRKERPNFLSRITSALSLKRFKTPPAETPQSDLSETLSSEKLREEIPTPRNLYEINSDDSFLLESGLNLLNCDLDAVSVMSDESIQSFYSELQVNDVFYDDAQLVYYDEKLGAKPDDLEQERLELRLQILKELY